MSVMMEAPGRASYANGFAPAPTMSPFPGPGASGTGIVAAPQRREPPPLSATQGPMPGTLGRPIMGPKKRLIITCDGTWLNMDNGIVHGKKQQPSNISRIGWAIKETSRDGIPQVVYYQAGVGTSGGPISRIIGGATGAGLKENVREAYTYIATNWREGDEIFLMGFSRGAFTARSVGGLIGDLGLLTRKGLPYFSEIFEDWEHKNDDNYQSDFEDSPFRDKGRFNERYVHELERIGMTRRRVPIKAICVWDTVGALGIPQTPWLKVMRRDAAAREYQFDDTRVHPCVENAFQALALDEQRAAFSPAVWEKQADNPYTNLKQVWFPGAHSNVGGGYDDQELANITLAWMMSRLEPFLDFRPDFLVTQLEEQREYYRETSQKLRWWSFGEIYNSLKGAYLLAGKKVRTPGAYQRVDPTNGRSTGKRLKNTNEYIHASVRARIGLRGPGPEDRDEYNPPALADWTFEPEPPPAGGAASGQSGNLADGMMIVWNYRGDRDRDHDGQTRIPEAVLLETELAMLRQFQVVDDYIRYMRPPRRERRVKRAHVDRSRIAGPPAPTGAAAPGPYTAAPPAPYMAAAPVAPVAPVVAAGRSRSRADQRRWRERDRDRDRDSSVTGGFGEVEDGDMERAESRGTRHRRRSSRGSAGSDSYSDEEPKLVKVGTKQRKTRKGRW